MDVTAAQAKVQVAVGSALATTPLWVSIVQNVSMVAGMLAAIAGAIIGMHGVYRLIRGKRK